jgi:hypothetical protein
MSNFVQANEYYLYMYAKYLIFSFVCIVVNKYPKIWIIGIIYKAILHKIEFSQAYCQDLIKRIPMEFILYFSDLSTIFYEFWNPIWISVI